MKFAISRIGFAFLMIAVLSLITLPLLAEKSEATGKLKIHVHPKQAYVFVDGKGIRDGSQTIALTPGSHEVSVRNYGYIPKIQVVQITSGDTQEISVDLQKSGDKVSGPFGDIEFKGHPRDAVLLNGKTEDYFVGHVDEFDWNWIWHQRLLVRPGTYNVTVTREGNPVWSGPVSVKAGEQVTVYLDKNGETKTKSWPEGNTIGPQPRFHAGIASATVPVAPVTASLTAQSNSLGCGQSTNLKWNSANAVVVSITKLGDVSPSGDQSVSPTKTTKYELVAKGPGGEATESAKVDVNAQPTATLTANQQEVHFHKIGDKVVVDDPVTLNWSASNANRVTITNLGTESASGSKTVEPQPTQTSTGPVNEVVNYTLSATNPCGGTATQTAAVRLVGSIDPAPPVVLASVFYPSNYPTAKRPKVGLVGSEKAALSEAANRFKSHEEYDNDDATLMVVGHADVRGPGSYNLKLSQRRAEMVKDYLVSQGIAADKIQIQADGKRVELNLKLVAKLQNEDPEKPEKWMTHHAKATWMAYNRRVDIILEPAGTESAEAYPNGATDARILWERAQPGLRKVELAGKAPAPASAGAHPGV
jgi:outer membrane protein OmpA-like peptidoglycan-associated protein